MSSLAPGEFESTAPKLRDHDTVSTVRYFDQLHKTALTELELKNVNGTLPPKVPVALSSNHNPWWFQHPCPRLLAVFFSRYRNESDIKQGAVDSRMVVDLAFATYHATRWKLKVANLIRDGLEAISSFESIFDLPTSILIEWIMREQRHITLFDGDMKRHEARNDGDRPPRVSRNLLRKHCIHCAGHDTEPSPHARAWDPRLDASFKFKTVRDPGGKELTLALPFSEQDNWSFHIPEPGSKGDNDCEHTSLTNCLDKYVNNWVDDYRPDEEGDQSEQPDPKPDTVAEDTDAIVLDGRPAAYYSPAAFAKEGEDGVATPGYLKAGPGFARNFPRALAGFASRYATPGSQFLRSEKADLPPPDPCLLMFPPSNLPIANVVKAEAEDLEALKLGCSQGCGAPGIIRFRASNDPVAYSCPFPGCAFSNGQMTTVHRHMDDDCNKKPAFWRRPREAKVHHLPPLPSKGCGHTLCTFCLSVSIFLAPPMAICPVCYTVAGTIRMKHPGIVRPTPDVPELWRSRSFHDHLEDRLRFVRRMEPSTIWSWSDDVYTVDEVDRPPLQSSSRQRDAKATANASMRDDADENAQTIRDLRAQLTATTAQLSKATDDLIAAKAEATVHERQSERFRAEVTQLQCQLHVSQAQTPQQQAPPNTLQGPSLLSLLSASFPTLPALTAQVTPRPNTPNTQFNAAALRYPSTPPGETCPTPSPTGGSSTNSHGTQREGTPANNTAPTGDKEEAHVNKEEEARANDEEEPLTKD